MWKHKRTYVTLYSLPDTVAPYWRLQGSTDSPASVAIFSDPSPFVCQQIWLLMAMNTPTKDKFCVKDCQPLHTKCKPCNVSVTMYTTHWQFRKCAQKVVFLQLMLVCNTGGCHMNTNHISCFLSKLTISKTQDWYMIYDMIWHDRLYSQSDLFNVTHVTKWIQWIN